MKIKETRLYTQTLKDVPNLESMLRISSVPIDIIAQIHIQSSQFNPKSFLEVMHKGTSIEELKRGKDMLKAAETVAGESEKSLIMHNVHHFAMAKRVLEEVKSSMFGTKSQLNIYSLAKDARENLHTFASQVRHHLDPIKKNVKALDDLDRDMAFIQSLDDFFELNAQIVRNVENVPTRFSSE
ncbi:MAG: hypothetical protein P4M11_06960 [Candidatus Pacebacteria bacterium]|nr:hypothetical protein [Candidatus Paceibacterota bacterium]